MMQKPPFGNSSFADALKVAYKAFEEDREYLRKRAEKNGITVITDSTGALVVVKKEQDSALNGHSPQPSPPPSITPS